MRKNKLFKAYLLTGAITLGVIGAAHSPAFADTNSTTAPADGFQGLEVNMQSIMGDAKTQIKELIEE
ncbi:MAG TPA: hypothetical protein GXX18_03465 [Bacillales bacterium]|nr:hypothetical protein [Bacillales bacterium]